MKKLIIVAALLSIAAASHAATLTGVPVLSPKRASLAAVTDYSFYSGPQAPSFPVKKEWRAGLAFGYKLTAGSHAVSFTLPVRYGFDSKQFESGPQLVILLWSGTGE